MRAVIYSNSYEKSLLKLEELANQYRNIKEFRKSKTDSYFTTFDGDYYRIVTNDRCKGVRCDRLYIGEEVSRDIVDYVFIPFVVGSKVSRDEMVVYF